MSSQREYLENFGTLNRVQGIINAQKRQRKKEKRKYSWKIDALTTWVTIIFFFVF